MEEIYRKAIELYGERDQIDMAIEEFAELIVALNHYRRNRADKPDVLDEIADASIMLDQLRILFDISDSVLATAKYTKVIRLLDKMAVSYGDK